MYGTLSGQSFGGYAAYIQQRSAFVMSQFPAQIPFQITTNGGNNLSTDQGSVVIAGDAWINVKQIFVAGRPDPLKLTWVDADTWQATIPLKSGANPLSLVAYDYQGNPLTSDAITVTTSFTPPPSPTDDLRISEIMYNPAAPPLGSLFARNQFEFVELQNIGASTLQLDNVEFSDGIMLDLPNVSLAPGEYGVVVSHVGAFTSRYGAGPRILGTFTGNLNDGGEHSAADDRWPGHSRLRL